MPITNFGPTTGLPRFASVLYPTNTPTSQVITTGTTGLVLTTAQIFQGILPVDCQSAAALNTPSAAAIVAAINGCQVGNSFDLDVVNYGAATLTITPGTGVTKTTIATVAAVLTLATLVSKRLKFIVTNVTPGSEAVTVWAFGSTAAAVA